MTGGVEEYAERFGRILQEGCGRVFPFRSGKNEGEFFTLSGPILIFCIIDASLNSLGMLL
jgi:hypothetical protein